MAFGMLFRALVPGLLVLALVACGGSGSGGSTGNGGSPAVESIGVTPGSGAIDAGQTLAFSAVARDAQGNVVTGATFAWQSSDTAVATIGADGVAHGIAAGAVTIRASVGGVTSNAAPLTVKAVPVANTSSEDLIATALAANEIDADTALAYRVFVAFGDSRLPARFRGDDQEVVETTLLSELNERFDSLGSAAQDLLAPYLMRPSSAGSWLDPSVPHLASAERRAAQAPQRRALARPTCHGVLTDWAAIDPLVAKVRVWYDTRQTGHRARAEFVANEIETRVWPKLITSLGFKEPADDSSLTGCDGNNGRLDLYIVGGLQARGVTVEGFSAFFESPTYILLRSNLADVVMQHTVAHELMHAIHWSYRTAASQKSYGWFRDALANWAADEVYAQANLSVAEQASCHFRSAELQLEDRATGYCKPSGTPPIARDYGAYLPLRYLSATLGANIVKQILEKTTSVPTALEAIDTVLGSDGLEKHWPLYALALWNQDPVRPRPDSFFSLNGLDDVPLLASDLPHKFAADLNGATDAETELERKVNNVSVRFYHFTFTDQATRSVMFHNTFYDNRQRGQKVSVRALMKPEGKPWVEEDWTKYEWIGLCRDRKDQRIEELVLIISSAEWRGTNPVVEAGEPPKLMRNNVGCWGFAGTATVAVRQPYWSSGSRNVTFNARFDLYPAGQYTLLSEGRLRVPISAPQFSNGTWRVVEDYVDNGCSYSVDRTGSDTSVVSGGNSAGDLVINYFNDALPPSLRHPQEALLGTAPRAYLVAGVSDVRFKGSVSGKQPDCGTTYETAVGAWLLTRDEAAQSKLVTADGHLRGVFRSVDDPTALFEWDLAPLREP